MTRHLLVIGAQRCGTTYLQALLDAHPDITMARPSRPEPKYFLSAEAGDHGLDEYRTRYFSHAAGEALLGEKSTSYIEHPEAAGRAAEVLGRAAIVVMLRDPVARAVSNWRFSAANGLEDRPLEEALADNLEWTRTWDPKTTSVSPYAYLERGRYDSYLDSWYAAFPGTTHVRFYEDLTRDEHAIGALYSALGVDEAFRPEQVRQRVNASDGDTPALGHDLEVRLRDYFEASDKALRARLGCDLPWSGSHSSG